MAAPDEEARMLATAQHIVRALGTTNTRTDDMLHILSTFYHRFSRMNAKEEVGQEPSSSKSSDVEYPSPGSNPPRTRSYTRARANNLALDEAQNVITQWNNGYSGRSRSLHCGQKWIFEGSKKDSVQFLDAVDEIISQLNSMNVCKRDPGTLERAQNLYNLAVERLIEEFRYMLDKHSKSIASNSLVSGASGYFRAPVSHVVDPETENSDSDNDEDEDVPAAHQVDKIETRIVLVPPAVAEDLADIAKRLTSGDFQRECVDIYVRKRKDILEKSLHELGVERVTIDEVQKMQWEVQETRIRSWNHTVTVGVKVLFSSEKQLCDEVFPLPLSADIFNGIGKAAMMQLLSFGDAIAISRRSPEKLVRVLDMYEVLRDVRPELDAMFAGASGASVRSEAEEILCRLGEAAVGTFGEFENAILRDASKLPNRDGDVHILNRYVMNYIKLLSGYTDTLQQLFEDKKQVLKLSGDDTKLPEDVDDFRLGREENSPLGVQIICLIHILRNNLEAKSKSYKDPALSIFFLMNNVHYIHQKVREPEIITLVGDDWVRQHLRVLHHLVINYIRTAWGKVLEFLRDEGLQSSGTSSRVSSAVLKDRFKNFNAAFDEAIRTESQWVLFSRDFRDELITRIAELLVTAYRGFVGRYGRYIGSGRPSRKYIKHNPDEIEAYVNNLFRGHSV